MKIRSAFTLTELCVLLVMLGLFVALSIPSTRALNRFASTISCARNLQAIGAASAAYANDNSGYLPPRIHEGISSYDSPLWSLMTMETAGPSPDASGRGNLELLRKNGDPMSRRPWGLGLLYSSGYLKNHEAIFCPNQPDTNYNIDGFSSKFLSDANDTYLSSYHFNPHHIRQTPGTNTTPILTAYTKLSDFPAGKALAVDLIREQFNVAHTLAADSSGGWNLLFPDGHVVFVVEKGIFTDLKVNGTSYSGWRRFDDRLDILQTIAAGEDINAKPLGFRVHSNRDY